MVSGIGVDICGIERVKKAVTSSNHFREEIFSPEEISYCEAKGERRYESYAGGFAAREAFCKASGTELIKVMLGKNFAVIHNSDGVPSIRLTGELAMPSSKIFLSISHEKDYAVAMVVIEKEGDIAR